jgi:hypothetical protein
VTITAGSVGQSIGDALEGLGRGVASAGQAAIGVLNDPRLPQAYSNATVLFGSNKKRRNRDPAVYNASQAAMIEAQRVAREQTRGNGAPGDPGYGSPSDETGGDVLGSGMMPALLIGGGILALILLTKN